jgi:hypothetical protein
MFSLIGNQRNFIKNVGAPEHTGSIQNDIKTKRAKKQGEKKKKKNQNPQRPNHNRNPKTPQQKPAQKPSVTLHHSKALLFLPQVEPRLLAS